MTLQAPSPELPDYLHARWRDGVQTVELRKAVRRTYGVDLALADIRRNFVRFSHGA